MASSESPPRDEVESASPHMAAPHGQDADTTQSAALSSTPIEMNSLSQNSPQTPKNEAIEQTSTEEGVDVSGALQKSTAGGPGVEENTATSRSDAQDIAPVAPTNHSTQQTSSSPPPLLREQTAPAIGPATDRPVPLSKEATIEGPVLLITLLLANTGARHLFKLDARYLRKRGVEVEENNPINMSLYKLKELILRDWREEWNAKPTSPESIRLITMGKLLNDKTRLADSGFINGLTPHIVHMTVKPQEIVDEEEANKATGKDKEGSDWSPGCRCVIQ